MEIQEVLPSVKLIATIFFLFFVLFIVPGDAVSSSPNIGKTIDELFSNVDWLAALLSFTNVLASNVKHVREFDGLNQYSYIIGEVANDLPDHVILHIIPYSGGSGNGYGNVDTYKNKHTLKRRYDRSGLRGSVQSADIQIDVDENDIDLDYARQYLLTARTNTKSVGNDDSADSGGKRSVHSLHPLGTHGNKIVNGNGIDTSTPDELDSDDGDKYMRYDDIMGKYNTKYFEGGSFSNSDSNFTIDTGISESKSISSDIADNTSDRISYTDEIENDNSEDGGSSLDSNSSGNDNGDRNVSDSDNENLLMIIIMELSDIVLLHHKTHNYLINNHYKRKRYLSKISISQAQLDGGGSDRSSDPMLNEYVVVSTTDDLLANQAIVPVVSDVSDDLNRVGSNSTSIYIDSISFNHCHKIRKYYMDNWSWWRTG